MIGVFQNKNDVSSSGFEDNESDTQDSSQHKNQNAQKISQIVSACTGYKAKDLEIQKRSCDLQFDSDEEEFYVLKVPKWFKPNDLENAKFSINKKSKVKTHSEIYRIGPLADVVKPELFIDKCGLKKIMPISILQLEKYEENKDEEYNINDEKTVKPIPKDLTDRHAIFGAKYEEKINLTEEIKNKIEQAMQRFNLKKKTPKKKKKHPVENEEFEDKSLLISRILEEKLNSKKLDRAGKKTNKIISDSGNIEQNVKKEIIIHSEQIQEQRNVSIEETKKKKKHKRNLGVNNISPEIKKEHLSDSDIPECTNEFNSNKNIDIEINSDSSASSKTEQNMKKEIIIHGEHILEQGNLSVEETKKKKKHKKNSGLKKDNLDGHEQLENERNIISSKIKMEPLSDLDIQCTNEFSSNIKIDKGKSVKKEIIIHDEHILEHGAVSIEEPNMKTKHSRNSGIQNESLDNQEQSKNEIKYSSSIIKEEPLSDVEVTEINNEFSSPKKSKKKSKKNKLDEEGNRDISIAGSSTSLSKSRKSDCEFSTVDVKKELMSEPEYQENLVEKKKKKRRRDSEHTFIAPGIIKEEIDDSLMPPSKKRRQSILSSTVIKEASPEFKPDVSAIENEMQIGKKKNKKKKDAQSMLIEDLLSNAKNNLDDCKSPKKKNKKNTSTEWNT